VSEAAPDISIEASNIEATMLLCDAAQAVNGKLYILGGGWSMLTMLQPRASMSLAVKLSVPWSRANERLHVEASLVTDQGEAVTVGTEDGPERPILAGGDIELGRPAGLRHGTPLDATFAMNFEGLSLQAGGYVWVLRVGSEIAARAPFQVITPTFPQGMGHEH
jgi:hypothetical protein